MANKYAKMTQEDFDRLLVITVKDQMTVEDLLTMPGIHEILSEEFNNEVLDAWEQEQELLQVKEE